MTSLTKKLIDVVIFLFCAFVGAIYFFYSIATQDILTVLITLGIYFLGFLSRKLWFYDFKYGTNTVAHSTDSMTLLMNTSLLRNPNEIRLMSFILLCIPSM